MTNIIKKDDLLNFCTEACKKFGLSDETSRITAEVLTETDMMGTYSHGTKNLLDYMRKIQAGGIKVNGEIKVLKEGPAWAMMDGDAAIGMLCGYRAMEKAIEKAKEAGIGFVNIKNSTHYGAAGYYACMAAKAGMIGVSMSNTDPNMTVPGGKGKGIGNSPISIAVPQKCGEPMFLDIALSAVAALKVAKARQAGQSIPDTWIVDKNGYPSTNPADFYDDGAAQPMAAHKGYGLAMMVEILTGVLAGGALLHDMKSWCLDLPSENKVSHCFIAIDISKFGDFDEFEERLEGYTDAIHNSPKRDDSNAIYVPGEIENARYAKAVTDGVILPDDVADFLIKLSDLSGVEINISKVD